METAMSRIPLLELDEMSPEVREAVLARERAGMLRTPRIDAHQPEMSATQAALGAALVRHGTLPPRLFESDAFTPSEVIGRSRTRRRGSPDGA
jgi:hypothetical protein